MGRPRKADIERNDERERWLDEIVTLDEAARLRRVSLNTLKREIKNGRLAKIQLSARRVGMYRREALKVTLAKRRAT